jgi:hypothetical protein
VVITKLYFADFTENIYRGSSEIFLRANDTPGRFTHIYIGDASVFELQACKVLMVFVCCISIISLDKIMCISGTIEKVM